MSSLLRSRVDLVVRVGPAGMSAACPKFGTPNKQTKKRCQVRSRFIPSPWMGWERDYSTPMAAVAISIAEHFRLTKALSFPKQQFGSKGEDRSFHKSQLYNYTA